MKRIIVKLDTDNKKNVATLHTALKILGYSISEDEIKNKECGISTKSAIKEFQQNNKLVDNIGELDEITVGALNRDLTEKEIIKQLGEEGTIYKNLLSVNKKIEEQLGEINYIHKALSDLPSQLGADGAINSTLKSVFDKLGVNGDINQSLKSVTDQLGVNGYINKTMQAVNNQLTEGGNIDTVLGQLKSHSDSQAVWVKGIHDAVFGGDTQNEKTLCKIQGTVSINGIIPSPAVNVLVFLKTIQLEIPLGESSTDNSGRYQIKINIDKDIEKKLQAFIKNSKYNLFLIIEVKNNKGDKIYTTRIGLVSIDIDIENTITCDIVFNIASEPEEITSEFESIGISLKDHIGAKEFNSLTEDDVTYLSENTIWGKKKIEYFIIAYKLKVESKAKFDIEIPPDFFYVLLTQGALLKADLFHMLQFRLDINLHCNLEDLLFSIVIMANESWEAINEFIDSAIKNSIVSKKLKEKLAFQTDLKKHYNDAEEYFKEEVPRLILMLLERNIKKGKYDEVKNILEEESKGNILELISKLCKLDYIIEDRKDKVAAEIELGDIILYDDKILTSIMEIEKIEKPADIRKLAFKNKKNWSLLLQDCSDKINTDNKRKLNRKIIENYASVLVRKMEKRYPTLAFASQLERDNASILNHKDILVQIAKDYPDFDLATTNIDNFIKEKKPDFGRNPETKVKNELKKVQRVFRLDQNYSRINTLINLNIDSAKKIVDLGKTQFIKIATSDKSIKDKEAEDIYQKAWNIRTGAFMLATEIKDASINSNIKVLCDDTQRDKLKRLQEDFPNFKTLFQGIDVCECEECRSITSPAAYLADVLQFLKNRKIYRKDDGIEGYPNARNALFERRPDIGDLDINCENSQSELPYIDIVCEILEEEVERILGPNPNLIYRGVFGNGPIGNAPDLYNFLINISGYQISLDAEILELFENEVYIVRDKKLVLKLIKTNDNHWAIKLLRQTHLSPPELAACPEYVSPTAYEELAQNNYAFQLPFDLYYQESKGYFEQFDLTRVEIMKLFRKNGIPDEIEIAAEGLGILHEERILITSDGSAKQYIYWNTAYPASDELKIVDKFLNKTGLTYKELAKLIKLEFIAKDKTLFIESKDNTCSAESREIKNLDEIILDRIHRFIRLWKKIGWKMEQVNRAIIFSGLGNGKLDDNLIVKIYHVVQIQKMLGIPVDDVLSFYGTIPCEDEKSKYYQLFLNEKTNGLIDPDFYPENIKSNEIALPENKKPLISKKDMLALCTGLRPDEVQKIIVSLNYNPDDRIIISFENITKVYSVKILAKALSYSIEEFLILKRMTETLNDPIIPVLSVPSETLNLIEKAEIIKNSGLKPSDIKYLIQYEEGDPTEKVMSEDRVLSVLSDLQKGIQKLYEFNHSSFIETSNNEENLVRVNSLLFKLSDIEQSKLERLQDVFNERLNEEKDLLNQEQLIDEILGKLLDTNEIKTKLRVFKNSEDDGTQNENLNPKKKALKDLIKTFIDELCNLFFKLEKENIINTIIAAAYLIDITLSGSLLRSGILKDQIGSDKYLMEYLCSNELIDTDLSHRTPVLPDLNDQKFDYPKRCLKLLFKITETINLLKISEETVKWMLKNNKDFGWFNLNSLPYQPGVKVIGLDKLEDLLIMLHYFNTFTPVINSDNNEVTYSLPYLMEYVKKDYAEKNNVIKILSKLTGWNESLLIDLDNYFDLSADNFNLYKLPSTYKLLDKAIVYLRKMGLNATTITKLIKAKLSNTDVQILREALKARYEETQWLEVLKAIQDKLRPQKRDSLVAYLLSKNPDLKDSNDLYDYFLVDVEMGVKKPTSRIIQAHGTVQLFVQRCIMGLEPETKADVINDPDWEQWKWMKNYRVWEANRKIFLYPENWMEPEFRDDKSFLFKELENELMQNEITPRIVEDATIKYLEKLDEIALLDICAVYYQTKRKTLHVFARTKGVDPVLYYYRRFENERTWTPWEKVELEINSDHLLPFIRNNRFYLAWLFFTEEAANEQELSSGGNGPSYSGNKARKKWKIQIAISEYANGKWLPKKVSKDGINTTAYEDLPNKKNFWLSVSDLGKDKFYIVCSYLDNGKLPNKNSQEPIFKYLGSFSLFGHKGYPELDYEIDQNSQMNSIPQFIGTDISNMQYVERKNRDNDDSFSVTGSLYNEQLIFSTTPGTFKITYPNQMSLIDYLFILIQIINISPYLKANRSFAIAAFNLFKNIAIPHGLYMPYFYQDHYRCYIVVPEFYGDVIKDDKKVSVEKTFTDILDFAELGLKVIENLKSYIDKNPDAFYDELVKDVDYIKLVEEYKVYMLLKPMLKFINLYHPLVDFLRNKIYYSGIPEIMKYEIQNPKSEFDFSKVYNINKHVVRDIYPKEDFDFSKEGGYSLYNWELFFHLPYLIAIKLNKDQNFEESQKWLHYIFNPMGATEGELPGKYWVTKPFYEHSTQDYISDRIDQILNNIASDPSGSVYTNLKFAVTEWRTKPFKPFVIARSRYVAFQKAVFMKYLENLIDWGDNLFRQYTTESINEATQIYILADKLLGPLPRIIPPAGKVEIESFNLLERKLDFFGNALVELENYIPDLARNDANESEIDTSSIGNYDKNAPAPISSTDLYFCIPLNEKLISFWETVENRLTKIRSCQTIEGIESIPALLAPPIDPGALARATAAGLSISDIVGGLNAPLPYYRFSFMVQKASELCQEVKSMGSELLQALEKKDAEKLAILRSGREIILLEAIKEIKCKQKKEAEESLDGLKRSKGVIEERRKYYDEQEYMNKWEIASVALYGTSALLETIVALNYIFAGTLKLLPDFIIGASGFGGSPHAVAQTGGGSFGDSAADFIKTIEAISRSLDKTASMTSTQGSYKRRKEEWDYQVKLADKELLQMEKQIMAAEIRCQIADTEIRNQELQIKNARETDNEMRVKFTNEELYGWMVSQISSVYFKAYKLAFDTAKKAERCMQFELGNINQSFIQFGYWDNMKKGLLSAEQLSFDLKRMELAYFNENKREFELTKNISISQLDPMALILLKNSGSCTVNIPEVVFDLDYPGQYNRRIKSVSLSIPCIAGPYTSVSCKLSLISSKYRKNTTENFNGENNIEKYKEAIGNDDRFIYNPSAVQSIATSHAQNDSGMFELNFRDERFFPFEGAGAISTWRMEMPNNFRQFDYETISDVIIHIKYIAKDGGQIFKEKVESIIKELLNESLLAANKIGLYKAFSLKHDYPNEWRKFKNEKLVKLKIDKEQLPYVYQKYNITIDGMDWISKVKLAIDVNEEPIDFTLYSGEGINFSFYKGSKLIQINHDFTLSSKVNLDLLDDLVILVKYSLDA